MYTHNLALLIPIEDRERVNTRLERNGYGPNNICNECIGTNDSDDADPTHLCGSAPVKQSDINSMPYLLGLNENVKYKLLGSNEDALGVLLEENSLRLKPMGE